MNKVPRTEIKETYYKLLGEMSSAKLALLTTAIRHKIGKSTVYLIARGK